MLPTLTVEEPRDTIPPSFPSHKQEYFVIFLLLEPANMLAKMIISGLSCIISIAREMAEEDAFILFLVVIMITNMNPSKIG